MLDFLLICIFSLAERERMDNGNSQYLQMDVASAIDNDEDSGRYNIELCDELFFLPKDHRTHECASVFKNITGIYSLITISSVESLDYSTRETVIKTDVDTDNTVLSS